MTDGPAARRSRPAGPDIAAAPASGEPQAASPRWPRLYAMVLGELAVTIAILYAFTRYFQ